MFIDLYPIWRRELVLMRRKELGARGESLAVEKLEIEGYHIRDRNWRTREGELDIVAKDGDTIVFVEVKARTNRRFGLPEEAVTKKKRQRLLKAALAYLDAHQLFDANWRFDFIAIECSSKGELIRIEHLVDIIQADPGEFL
jgi:putative endonuclease